MDTPTIDKTIAMIDESLSNYSGASKISHGGGATFEAGAFWQKRTYVKMKDTANE